MTVHKAAKQRWRGSVTFRDEESGRRWTTDLYTLAWSEEQAKRFMAIRADEMCGQRMDETGVAWTWRMGNVIRD